MFENSYVKKYFNLFCVFFPFSTETCKASVRNPASESNRHEWWRESERVPFGGEEEAIWTIQGEVLIIIAPEQCEEGQKKKKDAWWMSEWLHAKWFPDLFRNKSVNLSQLLSNKNPVCSLLPFVSITLQLFSVGSKVVHVQHTLDRLRAPYCHCLLCYLLKQQKNWSSIFWKVIDYQRCIVAATIGRTRRLWFCCCWSFFLFRHMSLVRICISLGEIIFMKVFEALCQNAATIQSSVA